MSAERESAELSGAILSQHIVADSNPRNRNREKSAISLPVGTTEYAAVEGHTEARQGSETAMDVKRSRSVSSDALPVECHDLHRRMAEVLALREKVASLDKVRKNTRRRAKKASDPCTVEQRSRSVL